MTRRRANAFTPEDNPFSGDSPANDFAAPEERQKPVTTRPRGGDVDRGWDQSVDLSVDTGDEGVSEIDAAEPPSTEARRRQAMWPFTPREQDALEFVEGFPYANTCNGCGTDIDRYEMHARDRDRNTFCMDCAASSTPAPRHRNPEWTARPLPVGASKRSPSMGRRTASQPMTPCMWCDDDGPDFTRSNGLQGGEPCEACGGTGQVTACVRGCGSPAPAGEACYECKIHDVMGPQATGRHREQKGQRMSRTITEGDLRRQATTIRPASPNFKAPKSCYVGGCSGTATFEVFNSGEPDKYACDDHVGSLAGDLAKQEREKLGRDRWASQRQGSAWSDTGANEPGRQFTWELGNDYTLRVHDSYPDEGWDWFLIGPKWSNVASGRGVPTLDDAKAAAESAARERGLLATGRRAFREPGSEGRKPQVGNNPSYDPSAPRAEDRARQGQNYDTGWRGERKPPYYEPLDPVYPRPGDEPDNVEEYGEDTGVEPANPQAASQWAIMEEDMLGYTGQRRHGVISVRRSTYRGEDGYSVVGKNVFGQNISIFVRDEETARNIQALYNSVNYTEDREQRRAEMERVQKGVSNLLLSEGSRQATSDYSTTLVTDVTRNGDTATGYIADGSKVTFDVKDAEFDGDGDALVPYSMLRFGKARTYSINKVSVRCADCGQQGKIALMKVTDKTRCKCGSAAIDFTDRVASRRRKV